MVSEPGTGPVSVDLGSETRVFARALIDDLIDDSEMLRASTTQSLTNAPTADLSPRRLLGSPG